MMIPRYSRFRFSFKITIPLLILLLLAARTGYAQVSVIDFDRLSVEEGLSEGSVTAIFQDHRGFMWFGTMDGLNRYDGHTFAVYRNDPADTSSLSDNYIAALGEDRAGNIWVATQGGGLDRLDAETGLFARYGRLLSDSSSRQRTLFASLRIDEKGAVWIGTLGDGLIRFDPSTRSIHRYKSASKRAGSVSDNTVWAIHIDHTGTLWAGTFDGLNRYDEQRDKFITYRLPASLSQPHSNNFNALAEDSQGKLWCAIWKEGIFSFDEAKQNFTKFNPKGSSNTPAPDKRVLQFCFDRRGTLWLGTSSAGLQRYGGKGITELRNESGDRRSLSSNQVLSLFVDKTGVLWVGTNGGGVSKYSGDGKQFIHYRHVTKTPNSLSDNNIWALYEDRSGNLWVGILGSGLDMVEHSSQRVTHFEGGPSSRVGLTGSLISAVLEDHNGSIWVGTQDAGLFRYEKSLGRFRQFACSPSDSTTIGGNVIICIFEDSQKTLWIGTLGGGLNKFDSRTQSFRRFMHDSHDSQSLGGNSVTSIVESRNGALWLGTYTSGLDRYQKGVFTHFPNDPANPSSLNNDKVASIYEDPSGLVWVGTSGGGLNRLDPHTGVFQHYTQREGLPNSTVYGILPDNHGNLWMSTNRGIARLDVSANTFRSYDENDGLQHNEFNQGAYFRTRSGELLFGGVNGFTRFHPDSVRDNPSPPPVVLTSFEVSGPGTPFHKDLPSAGTVWLSYNQNFFSIDFAALDYTNSGRNQFSYMIEGFDKSWVKAGNKHTATYTNVEPGEYVFRAIACNSDGVWNTEGASLRITIVPPFWKTWLAYALYLVCGVAAVTQFIRYRTRKNKGLLEEQKKNLEEGAKQLAHERFVSYSLRRAEENATASLREKEVLLKEVHHRVKNNMQVIASLLNLQANKVKDKNTQELFRVCQDRVRAMSLIHERLYRSESLSRIDFAEYCRSLVPRLCQTYSLNEVKVDVSMEPILLTVNSAIPCALIINELVTNSLKYAFPPNRTKLDPPTVEVGLKSIPDGSLVLTVRDNGVGFPSLSSEGSANTLGLQLVDTLARQLGGTMKREHSNGALVTVSFRSADEHEPLTT